MPSYAADLPAAYFDTCERTADSVTSKRGSSRLFDPSWHAQTVSHVLLRRSALHSLQTAITALRSLPTNWNSYGAPVPTLGAIARASYVLNQLNDGSFIPESAKASADGGVALVFVGKGTNRAVIEIFGSEEDHLLLYDTCGFSRTIVFGNAEDLKLVSKELALHLRGTEVAKAG